MTKLLEQAIDAVRRLPPETQDVLARWMLDVVTSDAEPEALDPAHRSAVLEGLAQARARTFTPDADVDAAFRRFGP